MLHCWHLPFQAWEDLSLGKLVALGWVTNLTNTEWDERKWLSASWLIPSDKSSPLPLPNPSHPVPHTGIQNLFHTQIICLLHSATTPDLPVASLNCPHKVLAECINGINSIAEISTPSRINVTGCNWKDFQGRINDIGCKSDSSRCGYCNQRILPSELQKVVLSFQHWRYYAAWSSFH